MILGGATADGKTEVRQQDLVALAEGLGVASDLCLLGFMPNPYAYMARSRMFALSSAWEGFGNVLVEALACGCPVVSTDCPYGPAEILDGGRYGRLVPVGDDAAMAEAMADVLAARPIRPCFRHAERGFHGRTLGRGLPRRPVRRGVTRCADRHRLPPRIALLLPDLNGGGVERTAVSLARAFSTVASRSISSCAGCAGRCWPRCPRRSAWCRLRPAPTLLGRLLVVASDPGGTPELARPVLFSWRPPSSYQMLPSLTRYLRRERPAALISAFPFENLLAIAAKRLAGVETRVIVTERNTTTRSTRLGRQVEAALPARAGPAPVPDGRRDRRRLGRGRRRARPAHRPAARADHDHPQRRGERHRCWPRPPSRCRIRGSPGQPPVVLGVGRLTEQKDFPTLLRAFARVRSTARPGW